MTTALSPLTGDLSNHVLQYRVLDDGTASGGWALSALRGLVHVHSPGRTVAGAAHWRGVHVSAGKAPHVGFSEAAKVEDDKWRRLFGVLPGIREMEFKPSAMRLRRTANLGVFCGVRGECGPQAT